MSRSDGYFLPRLDFHIVGMDDHRRHNSEIGGFGKLACLMGKEEHTCFSQRSFLLSPEAAIVLTFAVPPLSSIRPMKRVISRVVPLPSGRAAGAHVDSG